MPGRSTALACITFLIIIGFYFLGVYLAENLPDPYNIIAFYTSAIGGPIAILGLVIVYFLYLRQESHKLVEAEKKIKYLICPDCNTSVDKKKGICPKCGKNLLYGSDIVAE